MRINKVKFLKISLLSLFIVISLSCKNKLVFDGETVVEKFENGNPKIVREYNKNDSSDYKEIHFYPNGKKRIEGKYVNGKKEGYWQAWYENGNYWSQGSFRNGLSEGERRLYHENGTLSIQGEYDKGIRVGKWIFYDSTGVVIKTNEY